MNSYVFYIQRDGEKKPNQNLLLKHQYNFDGYNMSYEERMTTMMDGAAGAAVEGLLMWNDGNSVSDSKFLQNYDPVKFQYKTSQNRWNFGV